MISCPECSKPVAEEHRYCPACGAPLHPSSSAPTLQAEDHVRTATQPSVAAILSGPESDLRFLPGTILAGRYRIIGPLGRGGMGEVYRADDIKLGQAVALKFLPRQVEVDPGKIGRFFSEVRLARQVTHPNVCRVYDVGEVDGQHFISMEFVDGEDLASLERRIGRLPEAKALEVARQICAGLAAAHNQGILHRDLKPSNIMLDGRGRVRITDFGLAGLADEIHGVEIRSGTPAYMAPEQIRGDGVSIRSDLFALGLVLYELFTGRPARQVSTFSDLLEDRGQPTVLPSAINKDLAPSIDQIVMRCLAPNPIERPDSALTVAAALPGGDPLAEALAAGETPSPEMVAAARRSGVLRPWVAGLCLLGIILGGVIHVILQQRTELIHRLAVPKQPEVLEAEVLQVIATTGQSASDYRTYGYEWDNGFSGNADAATLTVNLATLAPSPLRFWYRQSPEPMVPVNPAGWLTPFDPPLTVPGMTQVRTDAQGRLLELLIVPPERESKPPSGAIPDWTPLLTKAGLDATLLKPETPVLNPLLHCDQRAAWIGYYPGQENLEIRVEAGAYGGLPNFFRIVPPWENESGKSPRFGPPMMVWAMLLLLLAVVVFGSLILMRRNLRTGRSDRKGAFRTASFIFILNLLLWVLRSDHVAARQEFTMLQWALARSLLLAGSVWILYIALEPYIRRMWPDTVVSWSRVITGSLKDPLVGRDVLFGALFGTALSLLAEGERLFSLASFPGNLPPAIGGIHGMGNFRISLSRLLAQLNEAVVLPLALTLLIVVLRILIRNQWATIGISFVAFVGISAIGKESWTLFAMLPVFWLIVFVALIRYGLLTALVMFYFATLPFLFPVNTQWNMWYNTESLALLGMVLVPLIAAAYISIGDRPLFGDDLMD